MKRSLVEYQVYTMLPNNKKAIMYKGSIFGCNSYISNKNLNRAFYKIERVK